MDPLDHRATCPGILTSPTSPQPQKENIPQIPLDAFPWKHPENVVCRMKPARRKEAAQLSTGSPRGAAEKWGDSQNGPRASTPGRGVLSGWHTAGKLGSVCGSLSPGWRGGQGVLETRQPSPPPRTSAPYVFLWEDSFFSQKGVNSFLRWHFSPAVPSQDCLLPGGSSHPLGSPRDPSSGSCASLAFDEEGPSSAPFTRSTPSLLWPRGAASWDPDSPRVSLT